MHTHQHPCPAYKGHMLGYMFPHVSFFIKAARVRCATPSRTSCTTCVHTMLFSIMQPTQKGTTDTQHKILVKR